MKKTPSEKDLNQVQRLSPDVIGACRTVFEERSEPQVLAAWLYGSALGARHRPDSDLDIAVLDWSDNPLSWSAQSSLMDALERASGWPVDLRMVREGCHSLQLHVLTQGRQLWISDVDALQHYFESIRNMCEKEDCARTGLWRDTLRHLARGAGQ